MQYIKILLSTLLIFIISLTANAQRVEVGIVAGGAGYIGDLNQNDLFKISGVTTGVFAKMNFTPFVGLGLHYNYGNIKGDDLKSNNLQFRDRGINFNTNLNEVSLIAEVNFFDAFSPISKLRFTPYVFAGIGGVYFSTTSNYNGINYSFKKYPTNGNESGAPVSIKPYAITIPYGAGLKYKLTDYVTLSSQLGYRTSFTDYIDNVGDYFRVTPLFYPYLPPSLYGKGEKGSQRGDLRKRDTYMFVSIGISYNFVSQKCFTF